MNAKDRKDYRRNHAVLLKHINRARDAAAELDAISHGQVPTLHNGFVRDLRSLLGNTYSLALGVRLELWHPGPADIKLLQRQAVAKLQSRIQQAKA
jgi:hypothetical protein